MDETLKAFTNPSWWILTVIVGLFLNVIAPLINRAIDSVWASHSLKKKQKLLEATQEIKQKVARLAVRPSGLVEAKLEVIYWGVRILVTLCLYLLAVQVSFAIPVQYMSLSAAPIALLAFLVISKDMRRWNNCHLVHNLLLDELNQAEQK